jgi:hypothetical protein
MYETFDVAAAKRINVPNPDSFMTSVVTFSAAFADFTCEISGTGLTDDNKSDIIHNSHRSLCNNGKTGYKSYPMVTLYNLLSNHVSPKFILGVTFAARCTVPKHVPVHKLTKPTFREKPNRNYYKYTSLLEPVFAKADYSIVAIKGEHAYKRDLPEAKGTTMWTAVFTLEYNILGATQLPFFRTPSTGKLFGLPEGFDTI